MKKLFKLIQRDANILAAVIIILGVVALFVMKSFLTIKKVDNEPITVVVTTGPLASIVKDVGEEHVEVITLTTNPDLGSFSASFEQLEGASNADLVLHLGSYDAHMVEELEQRLHKELPAESLEEHLENPPIYAWFSPTTTTELIKAVKVELNQVDKVSAGDYHVEAKHLADSFKELEKEHVREVATVSREDILFLHDGYEVFLDETVYEPYTHTLAPLYDQEPSLQYLYDMYELIDKHDIRTVVVPESFPKQLQGTLRMWFNVEVEFLPSFEVLDEQGSLLSFQRQLREHLTEILTN